MAKTMASPHFNLAQCPWHVPECCKSCDWLTWLGYTLPGSSVPQYRFHLIQRYLYSFAIELVSVGMKTKNQNNAKESISRNAR